MKSHILLLLFLLFVDGVFDAEADEEMRVMEGDDVTLHTNTVIQGNETVKWKFPIKTKITVIAKFDKDTKRISVDGNNDGPFKDRLEMNNQTGSLTIKNMRRADSGLYTLEISSIQQSLKTFRVNVTDGVKSVSVMEGDEITLNTDTQRDDQIEWTLKDKEMPLNHTNGPLTIRNITNRDSGLYKVQIISHYYTLHRTFSFTVRELQSVSVMEGQSVTLTGVTDIQRDCVVKWRFGDALIAEINTTAGASKFNNDLDERFKGRLHLINLSGSLIITDSRTSDSGLYDLQFICSTHTLHRRVSVTVSVSVSASGLHTGYIISIILGVLLVAAVVVIGVMYHLYRKAQRKSTGKQNKVRGYFNALRCS